MSLHYRSCTFAYRRREPVLREFDLRLPPGCTVLLGPNGAGKSTVLSLGASARTPDAGRVSLGGLDSARRADRRSYRQRVGWLPQHIAPVPGLTVREQAAYAGWTKGLNKREAWDRSATALDRVRLSDLATRRSHHLSGGQLRRLGIAQCLVHEAEILLLDEPTAGLDPVQRGIFRDLIGELTAGTSTDVVVSTHQTEDLADIYRTVLVIDRGQVVFQGGTDDFLALAPTATTPERRTETVYRSLVQGEG
ncbi:ATP-binding cassette domain-containing protein [Streptomyces iconiensis]|uniref:ATP-binding cassette domain-containing protein n=1 Tax=Streptomyces iconiensis TaxID=1384038 RepID=A0ABT7A8H8_9ACTN|nr:ATP-binding cassette domain-containing protein [Streptomyces iconiensis]MDJ1136933.1 ATP-binding cassette domain-containing protein [Streptomyces iconiensis]